jgi:predicted N-formylglutamate amidohydrolase
MSMQISSIKNYECPEHFRKYLCTHWAYDIGAKEVTKFIAKQTNSRAILSNFSRLLIDPNRGLLQQDLIRSTIEDNIFVPFNANNTQFIQRVSDFYLPYYHAIKNSIQELRPHYHISFHSFTKQYAQLPERKYIVGILYNNPNHFTEQLINNLNNSNIPFRINEPYSPIGTTSIVDLYKYY